MKKKILLITSAGRSGSTVLSKILNELDDAFNVNELAFMPLNGIEKNYPINTGERFSDSEIWQEILANYQTKNQLNHLHYRPHLIPNTRQLVGEQLLPFYKAANKQLEQYKTALNNLFHAIFEEIKAEIIIDSSKVAPYVHAVSQLADFDIYVLHLVRDPRAVAYSWQKKIKRSDVEKNDEVFMEEYSPRKSSISWQLVNQYAESLKNRTDLKYHFLKYEDFAQQPEKHLAQLLQFLNYSKDAIEINDNSIPLHRTDYGIWGNPNVRQQKEQLRIKYDSDYKKQLHPSTTRTATFWSLPLLLRYGYSINL
ncbi:MAG: sulfotransferase domain-containing protein [Bacteroidota bacterium]